LRLTDFSIHRPKYQTDQRRTLEWIADAHAQAEAQLKSLDPAQQRDFAARMRRIIARYTCGPDHIQTRGHVIPDVGHTDWDQATLYDLRRHPHGQGVKARTHVYDQTVTKYFEAEYQGVATPPSELIHVTCTGYVSPSGAQKLVAGRGWGATTRVTHAYHMGCYAAFPALRMAVGGLATPYPVAGWQAPWRTDIVHTELCSLHFDPGAHGVDQLLVQSLFADGFIRYSVVPDDRGEGLRLLALDEQLLGDSAESMTWVTSDLGMNMTLARDVPERIAGTVRGVVADLYRRADLDAAAQLKKTLFAIHPGGPKIIDRVREVLELDAAQVATSRAILGEHGNMSSATLPHVWARMVADPAVPPGTLIASLAFGPGLTTCAGLFRKQ